MHESPMSIYIKKYYRDVFGLALHLLYVDKLTKSVLGMDVPESKMNTIKDAMRQDAVYLNKLKKKGMF